MRSMTETALTLVRDAGRWLCGPAPDGATEACLEFLASQHRFSHFLGGPFQLARHMDAAMREGSASDDARPDRSYEAALSEDRDLIDELIVSRSVDHFLTYLSHLTTTLFRSKPEILRDELQVKMSDVLRLPDRDSVIQYAIDEYVRKLSFQGLADLCKAFRRRLGFEIFTEERLGRAIEAVAIRNAIVHNNGIVDSRLAQSSSGQCAKKGERVAGFDSIGLQSLLVVSVVDIDDRAREKWNLPGGGVELPNVCHNLDVLITRHSDAAADEFNGAEKFGGSHGGLACERCYSSLYECPDCAGRLTTSILGDGLPCTTCRSTGHLCSAHGGHWQRP
jgi:hypothetical protein